MGKPLESRVSRESHEATPRIGRKSLAARKRLKLRIEIRKLESQLQKVGRELTPNGRGKTNDGDNLQDQAARTTS